MHNDKSKARPDSYDPLEAAASCDSSAKEAIGRKETSDSLFKNWPLMSSIMVYCAFSLHDMAYTEVNFL